MKGSIETFVGIIMIALMVVFSSIYISAAMNTRNAQDFHSAVISEIEASNFSQEVIDSCIVKAKNNGFVKDNGSSGLEVVKMGDMDLAEVTLTYRFSIPFLNALLNHEIVGYAR